MGNNLSIHSIHEHIAQPVALIFTPLIKKINVMTLMSMKLTLIKAFTSPVHNAVIQNNHIS